MMNDFDDDSTVERYLEGTMSPDEVRAFTARMERDRTLRRMVEAERMIQRTITSELSAIPPAPDGSRARVTRTATSAPSRVAPKPERIGGLARGMASFMLIIGLLVVTALFIGRTALDDGRSTTDATSPRTDTSRPVIAAPAGTRDSASSRSPAPAPTEAATRRESTQAQRESRRRRRDPSSVAIAPPAQDTVRAALQDSAHIPLMISPAKINRPTTP